ncbi:hypothetical protein RWA06_04645 [Sinorhizobium meliloti]|uniref:hypothetical protein n=1 Tax=Rhizobium meliloti TaxID=382 RepID=UPI00299E70DE|nr:hypothetical protein [Sinorhizobium meliloti]
MKDWREIQRDTARRERRSLLAEAVTFERFAEMAKQKRLPVGSVWHWSTGEIYGPIGSADKENRNASAA